MKVQTKGSPDEHTRLLLQAQRGDTEAFAGLYAALRPAVGYFVLSINGHLPAHDREDVVQEVFLRVWQGVADYRGQASARTYLLAIARNVLHERLRQVRHDAVVPLDSQRSFFGVIRSPGESPAALRDEAEVIHRLRDRLPAPQRKALQRVVFEGLSVKETARRAGCSINAIYKRLRKAKKSIMSMVAKAERD